MAINSRVKGGVGERELAALLVELGLCEHAERTAQRCGKGGTADVVGLAGIHVEVKRTEKLNIWAAMSQAVLPSRAAPGPVRPAQRPRRGCAPSAMWPTRLACRHARFCRRARRS